MKKMKFIIWTVLQIITAYAGAISKEMQTTVSYETRANAIASRSDEMILLEHYEIPLRLLEKDISQQTPGSFVQSLVFLKNGEKHVRWIINPEDTKWHKEVASFLRRNGIPALKYRYFQGYRTASRSYIAVDPQTGAEFSVKVSTDNTAGHWKDKKQTWDDAQQIRKVSDYVLNTLKNQAQLRNIVLLDEPIAFGIADLDQAMVIRSYQSLSNSGKIYVPGFSVLHEETGMAIAKLNGSHDPAAFWNDHYNKPVAKALAEFLALTGMAYDSPHSQNFLVELDKNMRPTGKIVLRDFGDVYLLKPYFEAIGRQDLLEIWYKGNIKVDSLLVNMGLLHGNQAPSWIDLEHDSQENKSYMQWGRDFHKAFKDELILQTGVVMQATPIQRNSPTSKYIGRYYQFNTVSGLEFLHLARKNKVRENLKVRSCSQVFVSSF